MNKNGNDRAKKKKKSKKASASFFDNQKNVTVAAVISLIVLFFVVFAVIYSVARNKNIGGEEESGSVTDSYVTENEQSTQQQTNAESGNDKTTTLKIENTTVNVTSAATSSAQNAANPGTSLPEGTLISYPSDTASWQMICLNKNRYVDSSYESGLNLSYVAGSGEQMDSRAAAAYEEMYSAALSDGIRLTPCSGYRSYSTQKRLYYEFYDEYIAQGYSSSEAHRLTSRRRNPPGSSEHNIGICMDIICAASSANFQNTKEYAWLMSNAHNYGFILRYPEDKESITGVKFEPWHWRFVGKENASSIKNSGLCLEEYLGLV